MSESEELARAISNVVNQKVRKASSRTRTKTTGRVVKVNPDGTAVVDAGYGNTPVEKSAASVRVGDEVSITVKDGKATIDGNLSDPSASSEKVVKVEARAIDAQAEAVRARTAAETAEQDAQRAHDAADAAQESADDAQDAADAAQASADAASNSLKSVVQGATTVEKAVSVMQTALEAVVDYDPATDTTQEWFWHDANGAHVLGETSGYRNDITSSGMNIVQVSSEESVARFGSDGAQIGKTGDSHLTLDYHSLQMLDEDDVSYMHVSDLRGHVTGRTGLWANISQLEIGDGSTTDYQPNLSADSSTLTAEVFEPGSITPTTYAYTVITTPYLAVRFTTAPTDGAHVYLNYLSNDYLAKALTFGARSGNVGGMSSAFGVSVEASGAYSHAEGYQTKASGAYSHAEGNGTTASSSEAHAEGRNTTASRSGAHAEGDSTTASDFDAHAEGLGTVASGDQSHSEGWYSTASGTVAHAEGSATTASGGDSHAEGTGTTASGGSAHAEGNGATASAFCAHAEGDSTTASGQRSHSQNYGTIAASANQTAIGKHNVSDSNGTYALIIGNGTADNARSNAFAVDWTGDIYPQNVKMTDFVVEQGTSGIWTYRKWHSGIAECWGIYTASMAINTASASYGGYRSAEITATAYPFAFTAQPAVSAIMSYNSNGAWVNNAQSSTSANFKFYLSCGSSLAAADRGISIHAFGRWA